MLAIPGFTLPEVRDARVRGLEEAREELFREYESEYREVAQELAIPTEGDPDTCAQGAFWRLHAVLSYVPDEWYTGHPDRERVARPRAVLSRGGDCDDFVFLHGGIVRALHPSASFPLGSVYVPSVSAAEHVYLLCGRFGYDLVAPIWVGRVQEDTTGEVVWW